MTEIYYPQLRPSLSKPTSFGIGQRPRQRLKAKQQKQRASPSLGKAALPCHKYVTNSNKHPSRTRPYRAGKWTQTRNAAKREYALKANVAAFIAKYGYECCLLLTITFEPSSDAECERKFNSLRAGVLKPRYGSGIVIRERTKAGRRHYHVLLPAPHGADVRTGVNFDAIDKRKYSSASASAVLRSEWKFWREMAGRYGLGRVHVMPLKKPPEAIASYLAKAISNCTPEDRGKHLVTYINPARSRVISSRFSFAKGKAARFRQSAAGFARELVERGFVDSPDMESVMKALRKKHGKKCWATLTAGVSDYGLRHGLPDDRRRPYAELRAMDALRTLVRLKRQGEAERFKATFKELTEHVFFQNGQVFVDQRTYQELRDSLAEHRRSIKQHRATPTLP